MKKRLAFVLFLLTSVALLSFSSHGTSHLSGPAPEKADLTVDIIEAQDELVVGAGYRMIVRIGNSGGNGTPGGTNADNSSFRALIRIVYLGAFPERVFDVRESWVHGLAGGKQLDWVFFWNNVPRLSPGRYRLEVLVDADSEIDEINENNNVNSVILSLGQTVVRYQDDSCVTVGEACLRNEDCCEDLSLHCSVVTNRCVVEKPDLIVEIKDFPNKLHLDGEYRLLTVISNNGGSSGNADSSPFEVVFDLVDKDHPLKVHRIGETEVMGLGGGKKIDWLFFLNDVPRVSSGKYLFRAYVDSNYKINESNEDNNDDSDIVTVDSSCRDLEESCSGSNDCCSGFCSGGSCAEPTNTCVNPDACSDVSDCCGDFSCSEGLCVKPDVACVNPDVCSGGGCCGVLVCGIDATCIDCYDMGDRCSDNSQCCNGVCNDEGVCALPSCSNSGQCSSNDQCCSSRVCGLEEVCTSCYNKDNNCLSSDQCCGALVCGTEAICVGCYSTGASCTSKDQCCGEDDGAICRGGSCCFGDGGVCSTNEDCCSPFVCDTGGTCVQPSECRVAGVSGCSDDVDCCDDAVCSDSTCCSNTDGSCSGPEDCCTGLTCNAAGVCEELSGCSIVEEACSSNQACCGALVCGTEAICVGCYSTGASCTSKDQCCGEDDGAICRGGSCCFGDGGVCSTNEDCCSPFVCDTGGTCVQPSECRVAGVSGCSDDVDCCDDAVCSDSTCCSNTDGSCSGPEDCCTGLTCNAAGVCEELSGCSIVEEACSSNQACCGALVCGTEAICVGCYSTGASCTSKDQCCGEDDGAICRGGSCCFGDGGVCSTNEDCCSPFVCDTGGTCVQPSECRVAGVSGCSDDVDCCDDAVCSDSTCCSNTDGSCSGPEDCCTGLTCNAAGVCEELSGCSIVEEACSNQACCADQGLQCLDNKNCFNCPVPEGGCEGKADLTVKILDDALPAYFEAGPGLNHGTKYPIKVRLSNKGKCPTCHPFSSSGKSQSFEVKIFLVNLGVAESTGMIGYTSAIVYNLNPDDELDIIFNWTYVPNTPGNYKIQAVIDSGGYKISDSDRTNNVYQTKIIPICYTEGYLADQKCSDDAHCCGDLVCASGTCVGNKPDLTVRGMVLREASSGTQVAGKIAPGTDYTITAHITNKGRIDTEGPFNVSLLVYQEYLLEPSGIKNYTIEEATPAGGFKTLEMTFDVDSLSLLNNKKYTFAVTADTTEKIDELNERNNRNITHEVTFSSLAELVVGSILNVPNPVVLGRDYTMTVKISNEGTRKAPASKIVLKILNGTRDQNNVYGNIKTYEIKTYDTPEIPAGSHTIQRMTFSLDPSTFDPGDNYWFLVNADVLGNVPEDNKKNNAITTQIVTVEASCQGQNSACSNTLKCCSNENLKCSSVAGSYRCVTCPSEGDGCSTYNPCCPGKGLECANSLCVGTKPDLTVDGLILNKAASNLEPPNTLVLGNSYYVSANINNKGGKDSSPFEAELYIWGPKVPIPRTVETYQIEGISAGSSIPKKFLFYFGLQDIPAGNYWLVVRVDSSTAVDEINEQNNNNSTAPVTVQASCSGSGGSCSANANCCLGFVCSIRDRCVSCGGLGDPCCRSSTCNANFDCNGGVCAVRVVAKPDLVVSTITDFSVSDPVVVGSRFSVTARIRNSGTSDALDSIAKLHMVRSNRLLGTAWEITSYNVRAIRAGSSLDKIMSFTVPSNLPSDTYHFRVEADSSGSVSESNEDNNAYTTYSSVTVRPSCSGSGGSCSANANCCLGFVCSIRDRCVSCGGLGDPCCRSSTCNANFDCNGGVCAVRVVAKPDLVVSTITDFSVSDPVVVGSRFSVTARIRNSGTSDALDSIAKLHMVRSNRLLGTAWEIQSYNVRAIRAGSSLDKIMSFTVPSNLPSDTYHFRVEADSSGSVSESNEDNNAYTTYSSVTVRPSCSGSGGSCSANANCCLGFVCSIRDRCVSCGGLGDPCCRSSTCNANFDCNGGVCAVRVVAKPDLVVSTITDFSVSDPVVVGSRFSVTARIRNSGTSDALDSIAKLHMVRSNRLLGTAWEITSYNVRAIRAGSSLDKIMSFTVPSNLPSDTYHFRVEADSSGSVSESNEDNNAYTTYSSVTVRPSCSGSGGSCSANANCCLGFVCSIRDRCVSCGGLGDPCCRSSTCNANFDCNGGVCAVRVVAKPDLVVSTITDFSVSDPVVVGSRFSVTARIRNSGTSDALDSIAKLHMVRSNRLLGTAWEIQSYNVRAIRAGSSLDKIMSFTVPSNLPSDTYHFRVEADSSGSVSESNEDNNAYTTYSSVTVRPSCSGSGGSCSANANCCLGFVCSIRDRCVSCGGLGDPCCRSSTCNANFDCNGGVCAVRVVAKPDLVVSTITDFSVSNPVVVGSRFSVTARIRNSGTSDALDSIAKLHMVRSNRLLGTAWEITSYNVKAIRAGSSLDKIMSFTVPSNLPSDTYHFRVEADSSGSVSESNEDNNAYTTYSSVTVRPSCSGSGGSCSANANCCLGFVCSIRDRCVSCGGLGDPCCRSSTCNANFDCNGGVCAVRVVAKPDLVVSTITDFSVSNPVVVGSRFSVTARIRNSGTSDALDSIAKLHMVRSNRLLGTAWEITSYNVKAIRAGSSLDKIMSFTVPSNLPSDTYHFRVEADSSGSVSESNEDNNAYTTYSSVTVRPSCSGSGGSCSANANCCLGFVCSIRDRCVSCGGLGDPCCRSSTCNANFDCNGGVCAVRVVAKPDLVVSTITDFSVSNPVVVGSRFSVTARIRNSGTSDALDSIAKLHMVRSNRLLGTAWEIQSYNVKAIRAGSSLDKIMSFTVPSNLPSDTYHFRVEADSSGSVSESNEDNNAYTTYSSVTVRPSCSGSGGSCSANANCCLGFVCSIRDRCVSCGGLGDPCCRSSTCNANFDCNGGVCAVRVVAKPDLVVSTITDFSVSNPVVVGSRFSVTARIRNSGTSDALDSIAKLHMVRSNRLLGTAWEIQSYNVKAIRAGSSLDKIMSFTVPSNLPSDTYHFRVEADSSGSVSESNEDNNAYTTYSSVTVRPSCSGSGGSCSANANCCLGFVCSIRDRCVSCGGLGDPCCRSSTCNANFDCNGGVCAVRVVAKPDLVVSTITDFSVSNPVVVGSRFSVTARIRNSGTSDALDSIAKLHMVRSNRLLGTAWEIQSYNVKAIRAGSSLDKIMSFTVPSNLPSDTYHFRVEADSSGSVSESNEDNNAYTTYSSVTVRPSCSSEGGRCASASCCANLVCQSYTCVSACQGAGGGCYSISCSSDECLFSTNLNANAYCNAKNANYECCIFDEFCDE